MPDVKISPVTLVMGLAGVLILGALGWLTFGPKPAPAPPPKLTQEARAYLGNLKLSEVHMQEADSFAQGRLVEILGNVTNAGTRAVKLVEVTCIFHDYARREVARERVFVVNSSSGGLAPGQTKPFRLAFDDLANTWDQAIPTLAIAQIQFQ